MAVDFVRASSQFLDLGTTPKLNLAGDFSVAAWVFRDDASESNIYSEHNSGDNDPWARLLCNGGVATWAFRNDDASGEQSVTRAVSSSVWAHVAGTRSGTAFRVYVDGVSTLGTFPIPSPITRNKVAVAVMNRLTPGGYADGRMEDVRVFNRLLSPTEVAILWAGYRGPLGGEVLWLPMDGARAIAHFDGATLVAATNYLNDMSGNGNHGDPAGNPLGRASGCPRLGGITD